MMARHEDGSGSIEAQCPFCAAAWTGEMLAEFELFSTAGCGCGPGAAHAAPAERPQRDLCCSTCGRAIYLKPPHSHP